MNTIIDKANKVTATGERANRPAIKIKMKTIIYVVIVSLTLD
jgi:hypothetical protein